MWSLTIEMNPNVFLYAIFQGLIFSPWARHMFFSHFSCRRPKLVKREQKGEKPQPWSKVFKTWRLVKAKSSSFLLLTLKSPFQRQTKKASASSSCSVAVLILPYKVQSKNNNDRTGLSLTVLSNIVQQQDWPRQNAGVPCITWGPIGSLLLFFSNISSIFS